jgi:riboflavin synthase
MFTGIVKEVGSIVSVPVGKLVVAGDQILEGIELGGSVAVNGICLTVTEFSDRFFSVDVMPETMSKTNLGKLRPGDKVNLERPLGLGGEIGGHLVQGHIDDTGKVASVVRNGEALLIKFQAPPEVMRYIVSKGFIAVDGTSLTVVEKDNTSFSVSIVGFTRQNTILANRKLGDIVNLEVDIIGKYVAEFMKPQETGVTAELLREHDFTIS